VLSPSLLSLLSLSISRHPFTLSLLSHSTNSLIKTSGI
jgi:hypothetical protein